MRLTKLILNGWPTDNLRPRASGVFMPTIGAAIFRVELKYYGKRRKTLFVMRLMITILALIELMDF